MSCLSKGVFLGLTPGADEQYFADTARALATGLPVGDAPADVS
ncbi:hypothetical protein [Streptomyces venezuelae]|nr:hypothetical protein [Streptomyces venezuelae]